MGSTAGAGSGDFHMYRGHRAVELQRLADFESARKQEQAQAEWEEERDARAAAQEAKSSKKADKRAAKKARKRAADDAEREAKAARRAEAEAAAPAAGAADAPPETRDAGRRGPLAQVSLAQFSDAFVHGTALRATRARDVTRGCDRTPCAAAAAAARPSRCGPRARACCRRASIGAPPSTRAPASPAATAQAAPPWRYRGSCQHYPCCVPNRAARRPSRCSSRLHSRRGAGGLHRRRRAGLAAVAQRLQWRARRPLCHAAELVAARLQLESADRLPLVAVRRSPFFYAGISCCAAGLAIATTPLCFRWVCRGGHTDDTPRPSAADPEPRRPSRLRLAPPVLDARGVVIDAHGVTTDADGAIIDDPQGLHEALRTEERSPRWAGASSVLCAAAAKNPSRRVRKDRVRPTTCECVQLCRVLACRFST